jgi:methyl-accepting chemotaxis protein
MREDVARLRRGELGYLLSGTKKQIEQYEESMPINFKRIKSDQALYEPTIVNEEERQLYKKFCAKYEEYLKMHQQLLDLRRAGKEAEARDLAIDSGVYRYREMSELLEKNIELNNQGADAATQRAATEYAKTRLSVTILLAGSLGFGVLVLLVISTNISVPLRKLVACFHRGAQGDLTTRMDVSSRDEVGQAGREFNVFMETLEGMMRQMTHNSQQLANAGEEISAAATQTAEGSRAQTEQVEQVATAMQEMSCTVMQVSEHSSKAAEEARKAAETAQQGGNIVNEALTTMRSIADSVGVIAEKIGELGKNSDQIGKIIAVIDDIADQTNLLALNAAIEAARAGEQGRGFAVVADEVRKLAERTTKATKEIAQMIEAVQLETSTAVKQMQAGTKQVEAGVATTEKAGASLSAIIKAAQKVGDMISQIATAATQQTSTADQINTNVGKIAKISRESASGAQQSANACEELSNLALDLQQMVSRFEMGNNEDSAPPAWSADPRRPDGKARMLPAGTRSNTNGHGVLKDYDSRRGLPVN